MTKIGICQLLIFFCSSSCVNSVNVVSVTGFDIELKCSKSSHQILWFKGDAGLSEITTIYETVRPIEFRDRLSITGNHANEEYHLTIATVKKTDAGMYGCSDLGDPEETSINLTVVDGPSNVTLDKTQNKLEGTEDQDLIITCTAVSEDPSPDMILQIKNQNFTRNGTTIQHTIQRVDRTYDRSTVTCFAGYQRYNHFNVKDLATIYLRLMTSTPTFKPDLVVGETSKPLLVTCTSTGGRPAPTERQWKIDNTDVTSYSDISSSHISASDTYTVTSQLTYSVTRHDNGKNLSCGFKNEAVGSYISSSRVMNIKYAPSVSVNNNTFIFNNSPRLLTCVADGNPSDYTYSKWQHKSKYGTVIRYLDGNSILTLPPVTEETKYQDTGEYVCSVSNGIVGTDGNVSQKSSGYVTSQAPPVFLKREIQPILGQTKKDVDLVVDVYSEPKYTSLTWIKNTNSITRSVKYTMTDDPAVLTDTFHGTEVQVDGYRITLTIHDLKEDDFVNYTLRLGNGVGQTVDLVIYLSASPPDMPKNLTLVGATDSTVTLQWLPAFNGGSEQTFIIEYRIAGTFDWKNTSVPKTLRGLDEELQTYSLSGLTESTIYEIRLYAMNKFNRSSTTDVVQVSTTENPGNGAVIGAVVGVLSGVGLIVAIVAVVVIRRRRDGSGAKKKLRSESEAHGGQEIISKPPESCEYAEVKKTTAVNPEVKKPMPHKKAKEKKQNGATNNNSASETSANQYEYENFENQTNEGYKNADGLQYADLSFSNPPKSKSGKPVIHGLEERTIYCDVDLTKKAPPLPQEGAYELTDIGKGNQS